MFCEDEGYGTWIIIKLFKMVFLGLAMVVDTFNPSTRCREEFQTNLVYKMSSRQAQGYTVRLSLNFFLKKMLLGLEKWLRG